MYRLGIDLGGTNIAAGVVDEDYKIIGTGKVKTGAHRSNDEIADDMANAARMAIKDAGIDISEITAMGIGSPGSVIPSKGIVATSNNLKFSNLPLCAMMKERLGVDFYIENDANAAAYGELLAGAGKGCKNFVAITLGTGVGSGIIIDGKIFSGSNNAGGELGHTVIVVDGEACTCGRKGCWETYASATALIRQTKAEMKANKESVMWKLCDGDIDRVNGKTAFDAMRENDESGIKVVKEYLRYVAIGITNVINIFQPEVLCIGGGISKEGDVLTKPITQLVTNERYSKNIEKQTVVKVAALGNDAGIIGAAFLDKLYR
ncbi:MAG: ROK family protein [Ruminococcaceae bacterium]|nr:ROK family protein [Oscillospiraceae bacterium]